MSAIVFSHPAPFVDAAQFREVQTILPTTLSSDEMQRISAAILKRAFFSARTYMAEYLQAVYDITKRFETGELDQATAILEMKQSLEDTGYRPPAEEAGTITDIGSTARRLLVLRMQASFGSGYGYFTQAQKHLIQWPAQELTRVGTRKTHRQWSGEDTGNIVKGEPEEGRWIAAGGELRDGRMVALVNDPIWTRLSAFGLPYPPFDFNSGMGVRAVNRQEAIKLGVISPNTGPQQPVERDLNRDLAVTADVRAHSLRAALVDAGYTFDGDTLMP